MSSANLVPEIHQKLYNKRVWNVGFATYFLVSDTQSRTSAMVSFNIETLKSGANPSLENSFIKFYFVIVTLENLLKMAVLNKRLNKTDMEKIG